MAQKLPPKICPTASGFLVHDGQVLLIKHKKLGIWLAPGGHIDEEELPHQAAEREFWEETGLKVKAISASKVMKPEGKTSYHPLPFAINLHWISKQNYQDRLASDTPTKRHGSGVWSKGCEQHESFVYLVEATDGLDFRQNTEETDGISWFTLAEIKELETIPEVRQEAAKAIELAAKQT